MSAPPSARFPATAWSCIEAARDPQHPKYVTAVNRLIATYWRPVFHFLRKKYPAVPDHQDLTQRFFLTLVTKSWVSGADPARGRFRNLLRKVLDRFAFDKVLRPGRQVQFEQSFVSIHSLMTDSDRSYEPPAGETPEEAFDREWKTSLLLTVRRNLEAHYAAAADPEERQRYALFAARHFVERAEDQPTLDALAVRFGISRDQVRYAIEQVRKRSDRLLRQEIRDQVGSEEEVEDEIRMLVGPECRTTGIRPC